MKSCSIEKLMGLDSDIDRKIIAFCGAGGKTSCIHAIRDYCLARNKRVLVTTTTHMFLEEGCVSKANDIIEKLDKDGYAFAGIPMTSGKAGTHMMPVDIAGTRMRSVDSAGRQAMNTRQRNKITAIPNDARLLAQNHADVTLIEADGARCLPFKVPKPWEPVIPEETTDIVLVMGMDAEGKKICDICYNPEGARDALGVSIETCLTREMMVRVYMETYVPLIRQNFKSARVFLYMNDKVPGKSIVDCGLFMI